MGYSMIENLMETVVKRISYCKKYSSL